MDEYQPDAYKGFGDIGAVLGGVGRSTGQDAFMKGAQQGATLDRALSEAKIKRDQAMQRDGLRDQIQAAYPDLPPAATDLMTSLTRGSENLGTGFSSMAQGMGRMQGVVGQQHAMALPVPGAPGYTPDTPDIVNQVLAASGANGPLAPSNVQVTPQADAKITTEHARADSSKASAAKHRADASNSARKTDAQVDTEHKRRDHVGKPNPKDGDAPAADEQMIGKNKYVRKNGKWGLVE